MDDPFKLRSSDEESDAGGAPDGLARDLRSTYGPGSPIDVPSGVDGRISGMARQRLAGRVASAAGHGRGFSWAGGARSRRIIPLRVASITAAAAAIVLVALIGPRLVGPPATHSPAPGTPVALRGDIDNNGRVDIVDALVLSARVKANARTSSNWDVDSDGVITDADARAIRAMVVRLDGGAG